MSRKEAVFVFLLLYLVEKTTQTPLINPDRLYGFTDAVFFYKEQLLKYYFDKHLHIHKHHNHYHHRVPDYHERKKEMEEGLFEAYSNLGDSDKKILLEELSHDYEQHQQDFSNNFIVKPTLEEIDKIILASLSQNTKINLLNTTPKQQTDIQTDNNNKNNNNTNQTIPTTNATKTQNTYEVYEDVKE